LPSRASNLPRRRTLEARRSSTNLDPSHTISKKADQWKGKASGEAAGKDCATRRILTSSMRAPTKNKCRTKPCRKEHSSLRKPRTPTDKSRIHSPGDDDNSTFLHRGRALTSSRLLPHHTSLTPEKLGGGGTHDTSLSTADPVRGALATRELGWRGSLTKPTLASIPRCIARTILIRASSGGANGRPRPNITCNICAKPHQGCKSTSPWTRTNVS
jgi:hypothetical protein